MPFIKSIYEYYRKFCCAVCLQNKCLLFHLHIPSLCILLLSSRFVVTMLLLSSLLYFVSLYIPIATCALATSHPFFPNPFFASKLTARQAPGSVPASQFIRRAFQGCKCCYHLRSIDLTITYRQQLLSLETGSILTEVKFPTIPEGPNMSTVSMELHAELNPPVDEMGVSNNTAFY